MSNCDVCRATEVPIQVYADAGIPFSSGYCTECTSKGAISEWNVVMVVEKIARMTARALSSFYEGDGQQEMATRLSMGSVKNALVYDMVTNTYVPAHDWWLKYSHQIVKHCTTIEILFWLKHRKESPETYIVSTEG